MAKLIILDGLSRTGKTTLCNKLRDNKVGRVISLSEKRPENTDITSFYKGVGLISNEFYKEFPDETFILDRSFLSELVFSRFFNRSCSLNQKDIENLLENNEVYIFSLFNSYEDYLKRSPKDLYTYTKKDYESIELHFDDICFGLVADLVLAIDTSEYSIEDCYKIITSHINKK